MVKYVSISTRLFLIYSDGNGNTILHAAVRSGSLPTVKRIVKCLPKLMNSKDCLRRTPAMIAACLGQNTILKHFFEVGGKAVDESLGVDLLNYWHGDHETCNIIVDAILETSGKEGLSKVTPLHIVSVTLASNFSVVLASVYL